MTKDEMLELLFQVGKLSFDEDEGWRLDHAELMDAYEAASAKLKCNRGLEVKNNDTDTHKTKT